MDLGVRELMLLQSVLEALLLIAVVALLWRSKKKPPQVTTAMPEDLKESFERFLSESSRFAESFQKNLEAKKELSSELLLKLDRRLADYQKLLTATEESIGAAEKRLKDLDEEIQRKAQSGANEAMANPAAPEVRAMVLQLAKKGLSLEDIAVRAKLHRGEVELIIDLEQRFKV